MVREISLSRGLVALVDDEDYERVSRHKWYAHAGPNTFYGRSKSPSADGRPMLLHHFILGIDGRVRIDHANGNGLDCQRSNMRPATRQQNAHNTCLRSDNKSGFKGVTWKKEKRRWEANIRIPGGKQIYLGRFLKREHAALEYDRAARAYFGEFACVNFANDGERSALELV